MSFSTFFGSFRHAYNGLRYAFKHERNFRAEVLLGFLAVVLSLIFPLTVLERLMVFSASVLVLTLELMNTAFERMLDMMKPQIHPYVKVIKDLVAGAVVVVSGLALVIGLSLFLPYLI